MAIGGRLQPVPLTPPVVPPAAGEQQGVEVVEQRGVILVAPLVAPLVGVTIGYPRHPISVPRASSRAWAWRRHDYSKRKW